MVYFSKIFNGRIGTKVIRKLGVTKVINSQSVLILEEDPSGNVLQSTGAFAVTDGGAGYAKGATHIKTDGGVGTTLYVNEGTASVCDFNAVT